MKIMRNNVSIEMSLEQFLNALEQDLFEELLAMIDLVDHKNTMWEGYAEELDVHLEDDPGFAISVINLSDAESFPPDLYDSLIDAMNYVPSKEDLKVQRILGCFATEDDLP